MSAGWDTVPATAALAFTALLLARAALHKAFDLTAFAGYLADYRILPEPMLQPAALLLPGAEIVAVAALLVPGGAAFGGVLSAALLLVYAGAMTRVLRRGTRRIACGCGGPTQPVAGSLVLRNLVLAGIALLAVRAPYPSSLDAADTAVAVAAGFTLWTAYLLLDQLLVNAAARLSRS